MDRLGQTSIIDGNGNVQILRCVLKEIHLNLEGFGILHNLVGDVAAVTKVRQD